MLVSCATRCSIVVGLSCDSYKNANGVQYCELIRFLNERAHHFPQFHHHFFSLSLSFRYMMIKGFPCKVLNISVSKTGKHGHAKCNFTATDIFTGKKYEDMIPSSHGTTVPIVNKSEWELIDIGEEGEMTLMDEAGNQKTDLNLPTFPEGMADEIRNAWNGGESQVMVTVQAAVGIEQVIAYKKDSSSS